MADQSGKLSAADGKDMTEEEFLAAYKAKEYPRPSVTVDLVIFTVVDTDLKVLMIKRDGHPFRGKPALPGGFVDVGAADQHDQGEDLYTAAFRELGEETGLDQALLHRHHVHLEQLYTFGCAYRDPRTRVIGVAYLALVPPDLVPLVVAGDDAAEAGFQSVYSEVKPTELAFDHARILAVALERLRGKIDYTPIAFGLVPATFTTSELREVYEAVKGQQYDAANFRRRFKRMLEDDIIKLAPGKRSSGDKGGRPAKVYTFNKHMDPNPNARPWPEVPLERLPTGA
jgi:8-oxo-dGTP diphosphatase